MINYREKIKPLDIIIVYNKKSWLHRLIKGVTGYKAGHVALYAGDEIIIEAGSTGVNYKKWKKYNKNCLVYMARREKLTESQEVKIRIFCGEAEHKEYAFAQLLVMAVKYAFRLSRVPDVSKKAMICSEFVAGAFASAGIKLVEKPAHEVTPGDILTSNELTIIEGWD